VKVGTVKWFNSRKGYGVIKPVDGGFNVYVHTKAVERAGLAELKEGQVVNFDVVSDSRTGEVFAENLSVPLNRQEDTIAGRAAFLGDERRNRRFSLVRVN
jgi:CspA family cold shock protein